MFALLSSLAWCACLAVAPASGNPVGMTVPINVNVRDTSGEPISGVKIVARSTERGQVLLTVHDSTSDEGVAELKVLALHQFAILAESDGFVSVVVGPTFPNLGQRLVVVMNRTEVRQFVPLK